MLEHQDLKDFSVDSWYENFKDLCLETVIVSIPDELLTTLRSESSDLDLAEACDDNFKNQLKNAIKTFNNQAFVKNNWHAPIDSKFISFGYTLQVSNVSDIFLYFSASDILSRDFSNEKFDNFCIALKPWINTHPASEFRCIVVNNILRGITPRDWPTFYEHYNKEAPNIIKTLTQFFQERIKGKFPRKNFVFDVIIDYPEKIVLLDFGPLNSKTNLYAFTWKEIQTIIKKNSTDEVAPVFRYIESDMGIMSKADALFKIAQSQH